jgi:hypothetical protein
MRNILVLVIVLICAVVSVSAQTEVDLKRYFEGRHVSLKMNLPATKDGVNVTIDIRKPGFVQVGPPTTYLKEGLKTEEVFRLLGKPLSRSERVEKDMLMTIYEFARGEGRILVAEFINDALVRSSIETREKVLATDF